MSSGEGKLLQGKRSRSSSRSPPTSPTSRIKKEDGVAAFLFRRDFRVEDNTAFISLYKKAAEESLRILPLFFFNPIQCEKENNPYFGDACFQFLCESLQELDKKQLHDSLVCLRGNDEECLERVRKSGYNIELLGYNADFTPFAMIRDAELNKWCDLKQIKVISSANDFTLLPLDTVTREEDQPYSIFTPFYKRLMADHVPSIPKPNYELKDQANRFVKGSKANFGKHCVDVSKLYSRNDSISDHGGREEGLRRLNNVPRMKNYAQERNLIPEDLTSHLSPHLKFGTVSIREAWKTAVDSLGRNHEFVRQLVWREFYCVLLSYHPRLAKGQLNAFSPELIASHSILASDNKTLKNSSKLVNDPFAVKYLNYKWKWEEKYFEAFKCGRTGVPLVDAAVRCLNTTGWCHNRCRMVIANFLVKVLHVDWREGERWYATIAVDFDVPNNSGGWLWSSGQGADAQPYFRTFNPFRQSANFDPDCVFIYAWVPELRGIPAEVIHRWDEYCIKHKIDYGEQPSKIFEARTPSKTATPSKQTMNNIYSTTYNAPIVDIKECTKKVIAEFKKYDPKK